MSDTYNGWVNRETWCAALHLSNDQHLYSLCEQLAVEALVEADQSELVQNESIPRDRLLYRVEWADVARDYIATAIENEGDK